MKAPVRGVYPLRELFYSRIVLYLKLSWQLPYLLAALFGKWLNLKLL